MNSGAIKQLENLGICTTAPDDLENSLHYAEFLSGVSQVLISFVYPGLAILLILEMKKTTKHVTFALSRKSSEERNRSAKMILLMTVFYVICSAPCGTLDFLQMFLHGNFVFETVAEYGSVLISILFCLNAMSHTLLNFTMSSKYRETFGKLFSFRKPKIHNTPSAVGSTSHK